MYLWYSYSKVCIAYLGDVPEKELEDSEWFDGGWTLQELIAPKDVSFFDRAFEIGILSARNSVLLQNYHGRQVYLKRS